jgi:hypothetical protein
MSGALEVGRMHGNVIVQSTVARPPVVRKKKVAGKKKRGKGIQAVSPVVASAPIAIQKMGLKHGVPGHYRVALQYSSPADAAAALDGATVHGNSVVFFVRAIDRSGGLNRNAPMEIKVDW